MLARLLFVRLECLEAPLLPACKACSIELLEAARCATPRRFAPSEGTTLHLLVHLARPRTRRQGYLPPWDAERS